MTLPVPEPGFYADFRSLDALKRGAQAQDPQALREAARQFESLFARMMISSMRAASFGDSLFSSDQHEFYQSMFDDQLAVELTRGRGLGLADMLVEQLTRAGLVATPSAPETQQPADGTQQAAHGTWRPSSREEFARELWPHAEQAASELGVDPRLLVAHAALETGWGQSIPQAADGSCSFNLFGIKAGRQWEGPAVGVPTLEFENGLPVRRVERFRAYASAAESFADYVSLIRGNPRYADALGCGGDAAAFASALQRGGYATDPDYAGKLAAVVASLDNLLSTGAAAPHLKVAANRPIPNGGEAT